MSSAPPPISPYPRGTSSGPTCPQCNSVDTKEVKYTWWGGVLGPKMMNLQKCNSCKLQFNRSTNKSAKNAILVYNLVATLVALLILFVVYKGF